MATKNKGGRPTKYTEKLAYEICERLMNGETLLDICETEGMPCRDTIYEWEKSNKEFSDIYNRAIKIGADVEFDSTMRLPNNPERDEKGIISLSWIKLKEFEYKIKLMRISKINQAKYGEKITQEISGPDGKPIQTETTTNIHFIDTKQE